MTTNLQNIEYKGSVSKSDKFIPKKSLITEYTPIGYQQFLEQYSDTAKQILQKINEGESVCLEGGHIYTDEILTHEHLKQLDITANLKKYLQDLGIDLKTMLFIDDFHPKNEVFHQDAYLEIASKLGLPFDVCISENAMVPIAENMLQTLKQKDLVLQKGENELLKHKKKPMLKKDGSELSCSMLDSGLTKVKVDNFDHSINVLHPEYKKQQQYMTAISQKALDIKALPIHTFLTK